MAIQGMSQGVFSSILTVKQLRINTDCFQKMCQITAAFVLLAMDRYPTANYLSKFCFSLETANMHDFYRLFLLPYDVLFPIRASSFDMNQLISELELELRAQNVIDLVNVAPFGFPMLSAQRAHDIAEKCVKKKLQEMADEGDGYVSVDDFKKSLGKTLDELQNTEGFQLPAAGFDVNAMNVTTKNAPLLESINDVTWRCVDTTTVLFCLNEWGLINTAKWAMSVGQVTGLQILGEQKLLSWVYGFVCTAYSWQILEALRKLQAGGLSSDDQWRAQLHVISGCTDLLFHSMNYLNSTGYGAIPKTVVLSLGIIARGVGIWAIMARPKQVF